MKHTLRLMAARLLTVPAKRMNSQRLSWRRQFIGLAMFILTLCGLPGAQTWALEKQMSLLTKQPIGELTVAGRLSIDLHAAFMVSRQYQTETVLNWYNCGYSGGGQHTTVGGTFGDFGYQVPFAQRQEKYPHAVTIRNIPAVRFDGGDWLKGNFAVEKKIAGAQKMALEVWLRVDKPSAEQVIMGWQSTDGKQSSAGLKIPGTLKGGPQWHHIVVNCTPDKEDRYLDGTKIASGKRSMIIKEGHVLVLGGESSDKPAFKGDLAAVRLHDDTLTNAQIMHNFVGGVMLGTEMHNWWRTEPDKWFVVESEHFRHCVDPAVMAKWNATQRREFDNRIPGMFHLAELIYHTYSERLAIRSSVVSRRPEHRGDGIKYKIPIQPTDGGSFMGCNDDFGWSCQFPGFINPHELVHGFDVMTGNMQGNFWETHANFPQTYNGIYQTIPVIIAECSAFPSSGRTYYHDRLMFEHLAQTPEYGPMFLAKMWYDGPTADNVSPYPWQTFERINPNPATPLGYQYVRMVQRMVTWDYVNFAEAPAGKGNTPHGNDGVPLMENLYRRNAKENDANIRRFSRIVLEKIPYDAQWWRVPKEQAPQQLGWNICPLKFEPGKVSAELAGYVNMARGSDWRAAFVAVDRTGKPVYGEVFGPGKIQTFNVGNEIKELYLVVCAVPTKIMAIDMVGDFRSFEQEQFPYKVKLSGCSPLKVIDTPAVDNTQVRHANGGGFVAKAAQVDPGVYVGPNARVLGHAKILGQARIEDFAIVRNATVKDDAIVSGHALIEEDSVISGHARVRDFAVVKGHSTVEGDAHILEHATYASQKTCRDSVVVKGVAFVYGGCQSGSAMIDGFYAKGNEVTKGKWFTWSWGQGKNPGEIDQDFGGLYADYSFDTEHPWMAIDAFGATWGYLVNGPRISPTPDLEVRKSLLLRPEEILHRLEIEHNEENGYARLMTTYLLPPETGDYTFWFSADDEGELWIGDPGSNKADHKICFNPMYAGFRDFGRFSSQKSVPVHLVKGKTSPLQVLYRNGHMAGSMAVAWAKAGSDKPEAIPPDRLFVDAAAKKPGVLSRTWKDAGNLNALRKRPDFPEGIERVGGHALVLNGRNQFVELPKDVADRRQCTYTIEFKWTGGGNGARLFEFVNPNGDAIWLTPSDNGKLIFAIRQGTKTEQLVAPAVAPNIWTSVRVVIDGNSAAIYVNTKPVAKNTAMTLTPESIRATQCYLGRGLSGGYFGGLIQRFTIHSQPLK